MKLLEESWDNFDGSSATRMKFSKINRDDGPSDVMWAPPVLSFTIERHGGMAGGSTRAEKQNWSVNMERLTARAETAGYKQIGAVSRPFTKEHIAELVEQICAALSQGPHADPPCAAQSKISWKNDHEVHIKPSEFVPKARFQQQIPGAGSNSGRNWNRS